MPIIMWLIGFIISGLVWRLLASIGFGLITAAFVLVVINDYLNRSLALMGQGLHPTAAALLGIVGADECISVMIGSISFVAVYKSLKLVFVRS
ncbi:DUF2523 family protein [Psychrobacter aquimaris]|uniref:DUF2523 family protein n=1 Tax=Psychrobacter aquimaris TaxID=292733 RepID=UPI003FD546F9